MMDDEISAEDWEWAIGPLEGIGATIVTPGLEGPDFAPMPDDEGSGGGTAKEVFRLAQGSDGLYDVSWGKPEELSGLFFSLDANTTKALAKAADRALGERPGLYARKDGKGPRSLLLVHGTFSTVDRMLGHSNWWCKRFDENYDRVLAFEYKTLSRSAVDNAGRLKKALFNETGPFDVICHSQGALVVRYWLEMLDTKRFENTRVVVAGGALNGTALAAEHGWLKMIVNLGVITGKYPELLGLLAADLLGDWVSDMPGLQGMRQDDRALNKLRAVAKEADRGYEGWKVFAGAYPKRGNPALAGIRRFFGEKNDLVVDTDAQVQMWDGKCIGPKNGNTKLHHLEYFDDAEVRKGIGAHFGWSGFGA